MATRTRQRSMKDFFAPVTFDQSPMKAARRAGRTQSGSSSQATASASTQMDDVGEESEDPILLSPRSKKDAGKGKKKRSASPSEESEDGERKRVKLDDKDKEAARVIFGGTKIKPSATFPPTTSQVDEDRPPSPERPRAVSVPPTPSHSQAAEYVDLKKLMSPRRRGSPVRIKLRYTSEPADVKDLEMDGQEGGPERLESVAEVPATPTPGPKASMDALYRARKRMGSASPATPAQSSPVRPTEPAPLEAVMEEPVAHEPIPSTSSPPIPPATPDDRAPPPSYFNFASSPAPEPPSTSQQPPIDGHATSTPRDAPSRKRARSPTTASPADRLASSIRASKLLDSLFDFGESTAPVPAAFSSPTLANAKSKLNKSTSSALDKSTSQHGGADDELPPVVSPAKAKAKGRVKGKGKAVERAPSLAPSSRSSRSAKAKSAVADAPLEDKPSAPVPEEDKKPMSRSSNKSTSRAPQLEALVVDTERRVPEQEAGPSSEGESPLTALPSDLERVPSVPVEEVVEAEGDVTVDGGDTTLVVEASGEVEASADVEAPVDVEEPMLVSMDDAPLEHVDGDTTVEPMDEDLPAVQHDIPIPAAVPADPIEEHVPAPVPASHTPTTTPPPPLLQPETETDAQMSDLTQPEEDNDNDALSELTGLDEMSELTQQSEPEDMPVVEEKLEEEVNRTPVPAVKRGRGRGRGGVAGRGGVTAGRGRGGAARGRGAAPVPTPRPVAASGRGAAPVTKRARGGIPRAAPSTSRLTRSSSTRTVDSQESEVKGKGKEKEVVPEKGEEEVEVVKDVGEDAMDVDDEPSSSVVTRPKTPLKVSVDLPAERPKTPARAKTPGPGPFVRPKTPSAHSNAKSTGSDASSNAPPKRTGGFAAPTASSLSKAQASPTKKPVSSVAGPSVPRASSPTKPASSNNKPLSTTRPPLTNKSSLSSLSNLTAALERARAQTSLGFNRDVTRPAGGVRRDRGGEELPDRLDGSLGSDAGMEKEKGKGKVGGKEKEGKKLPPGQTTLGSLKVNGAGAGPSKINGAGPGKLNGVSGPSKLNGVSGPSKPNGTAAPLKRTASLGALGRGAPPGGGGGMKQATLPFAKPAVPRAAGFPGKRMYASKQTTLAPVKGSPVKGGAMVEVDEDEDEPVPNNNSLLGKGKGKARDLGIEPMDFTGAGVGSALADSDDDEAGYSTVIGPATPASRVHAGWEKNASRRASLASQTLLALQAQAQSPGTPPESERARSTRSGGAAPPNPAAGVPKVLKHCSVYVDVRGPEGDDQGAWFVDTLKLLGARVQARLGSACTHIVFRGGGAGTLQRYTTLPDPRPAVVGVGWVVGCAEQVKALETGPYAVDVSVASAEALLREKAIGRGKRKSMMLTPAMSFSVSPVAPSKTPGFARDEEEGGEEGDELPRPKEEEDITPLERAKRRREAMEAAQR